jgi:hypothetical protein
MRHATGGSLFIETNPLISFIQGTSVTTPRSSYGEVEHAHRLATHSITHDLPPSLPPSVHASVPRLTSSSYHHRQRAVEGIHITLG